MIQIEAVETVDNNLNVDTSDASVPVLPVGPDMRKGLVGICNPDPFEDKTSSKPDLQS